MSMIHMFWQRLGLGCLYAWIFIVVSHMGLFANPDVFTYSGPALRMGFSGSLTFFLIAGSFAAGVWRASGRRVVLVAAASLMSFVGTVLFCIAAIVVQSALVLMAGVVLSGAGNAFLMLSWGDYFTRIHTDEMSLHIIVSLCFASLLSVLVVVIDQAVVCVALVLVLPLFSGLIYCKVSSSIAGAVGPRREATGFFFWKMVAALLFTGIAYGLVRSLPQWMTVVRQSELGVVFFELIAFAFVAVVSFVLMKGPPVVRLYRLAFFLVIGGCIFVLVLPNEASWAPVSTIVAGQFLFQGLIWLLNPEVVIRFAPNRSVSVFGWTTAVLHGGMFIGALVVLFMPSGLERDVFGPAIAFFAFGLLALLLFAFRERDLAEIACSRDEVIMSANRGVPIDALDAISRQCRLTAREREVLGFLSQGRTIPYIADELCIAPSTVKTHVKHIYEKTGVSNRQELIDSVQRLER